MLQLNPILFRTIDAVLCESLDQRIRETVFALVAAGLKPSEISRQIRRSNPDRPLSAIAIEAYAERCAQAVDLDSSCGE